MSVAADYARILMRRHAWLCVAAADARTVATRWPDTERGMQAADDAHRYGEEAEALRAALERFPEVYIHSDPKQLVLFQEGDQ